MSILPQQLLASTLLSLMAFTGAMADEVPGKSHPCTAIVEAAARLSCYDAAFPPAANARSLTVDVQAERERALREFGLNKAQLRVDDPDRMREISPERIQATVVRVGFRSTGERVVTLDNGQVWMLTEVTSKGSLKSGDVIAVRKGALNGYMLLTSKRIPLRARRIQ